MIPCNDVSVMEMVAKAVGRLAQVGGTFAADYVEFEVTKALEWLSGDRHEGRRHAAVCIYVYILYNNKKRLLRVNLFTAGVNLEV